MSNLSNSWQSVFPFGFFFKELDLTFAHWRERRKQRLRWGGALRELRFKHRLYNAFAVLSSARPAPCPFSLRLKDWWRWWILYVTLCQRGIKPVNEKKEYGYPSFSKVCFMPLRFFNLHWYLFLLTREIWRGFLLLQKKMKGKNSVYFVTVMAAACSAPEPWECHGQAPSPSTVSIAVPSHCSFELCLWASVLSSHLSCASLSKMYPKVIASSLYTILAYRWFHRNVLLSNMGKLVLAFELLTPSLSSFSGLWSPYCHLVKLVQESNTSLCLLNTFHLEGRMPVTWGWSEYCYRFYLLNLIKKKTLLFSC